MKTKRLVVYWSLQIAMKKVDSSFHALLHNNWQFGGELILEAKIESKILLHEIFSTFIKLNLFYGFWSQL